MFQGKKPSQFEAMDPRPSGEAIATLGRDTFVVIPQPMTQVTLWC